MYSPNHLSKTGRLANGFKHHAWRMFVFVLTALVASIFSVTLVSAARLYAPTMTATKTDAFIGGDGDGKADPGETIEYTTVISATGEDATGVDFTDMIDPNTTLNGLPSASPVGVNDTFPVGVVGNVSINSASLASPFSVTSNDYLGVNPVATISAVQAATTVVSNTITALTAQGGNVVMTVSGANIGKFTYDPPPGYEGSDTFTYTLSDNANATSAASNRTATVTLSVSGMIWFIDRDNPTTCIAVGCGRLSNPFTSLEAFEALNDGTGNHPADNDNIFVYESSGVYTNGVTLRSGQKLIGQDATVSLSTITGLTPPTGSASLPAMNTGAPATVLQSAAAGNAISTQTNVIPALIRGLSLDAAAGNNAIDITISNATSGALEISENIIVSAGAEGIDINRNSTGTLTLDVHNNTWNTAGTHGNAAGEHGFDARTTATGVLNLNFHNNNVIASNASSSAVFIDGSGGGTTTITGFANNSVHQNTAGTGITVTTATFDATPTGTFQQVSGGSTTIGISGNGVGASGMVLTTVSGDLDFIDLDIFNDNGTGLSADGTGAIAASTGFRLTSTGTVASVASTGGPAVNISDTTIDLLFASIASSNSATTGVTLDNIDDGTSPSVFSSTAGSITDATGIDFVISNNNADVTYAGTITDDLGQLVSVTGNNGGTKSFTNTITDGNDGDGSGISLTGNSGGTIRFSGGLLLSTGGNAAFTATGNTGTTLEVCDENPCNPGATGALINTITTTTSTSLNVANTTIGANNLEFRSISSSGGSSTGIILDTTGSTGGLKVKGNGTASSGGTIANKSGSDGSTTTGIGIYLRNTSNVFLDRMQLNDFQNFAIRGVGVSGFSLNNSVVNVSSFSTNGTTTGSDEASISFGDRTSVTGMTGTATITNTTIRDGYEDNLSVFNWNGTLDLTVTGSIIRNTGAVEGNDGIIIEAHGTANVSVDVKNSQFAANRGDHFQATADDSAILDVQFGTNGANTLTGGHVSPLGQSIVISSGGLSCTGFSGQVTFNVSNNSINGAIDTPINVNKGGGTTASSFSGTINNNSVGTTGQANSGTTGNKDAIRAVMNGCGSYTAAITNNILKEVSGNGIFAIARDGDGAGGANPGNLDLTITGNQLSLPNPGNNGIRIESGATSTDDMDVCADIGGAGGLANTVSGDWGAGIGADEIRLRHQFSTLSTFRLPGFGGGGVANVPPYLTGRNSGFPPSTASATIAGAGAYTGGASCASPVAMLSNRVVVQIQPDASAQAQADVVSMATKNFTVSASSNKLSKQAAWAKSAKVTLITSQPASGNDQLISAKLPAPAQSGETVTINDIDTIPMGKSVKIVFRVTVNSPLPQDATRILNQGTISGSNFSDILTTESPADSNPQCTASPSIGTQTCTPIDLVDLSVLKSNDTSNTVVLGNSFTWQVQVSNIAASRSAIFTNGQTILEDHLPSSATYATPGVTPTGGIVGTPNCSITSNVLTCTAPAGGLTIPSGEAFAVAFTTTPNTPGSLVNPTGGVCEVDPNVVFAENSTANNTCSNTVTVTRPETTAVSLTRQSANPTNNATVTWQIVFADAVDGVTASNFSLVQGGSVTGASIGSVTETSGPPSTTWNITANTGSGSGTLGLDFVNDTGMNYAVTNTTFIGEVYTIDKTPPTTTSFTRFNPSTSPTNADTLIFQVSFSEDVQNVGPTGVAGDFTVTGTTATVTSISSGPQNFTVTVSGGNLAGLNGTVGLNFNSGTLDITDLAGNPLASTEPSTDETYLVDNTAPTVTINQAIGQSDPTGSSPINFTAVFSQAVTGFATGDVDLSGTAGATTAVVTEITPMDGTTYNVAVSGMTGGGTVIASIDANKAQDLAGNDNTASTSTDNSVIYATDLSITKTDGVTTATPGGSVTYTITASNIGPNDDPAATVIDTFPASLTVSWTCVGSGGGTCTAGPVAGNINDTVNLPVGGSVTYTATATISPSASGTLVNTATVTSSFGDFVSANNSATDTDTLTATADLAITKTDGVTTAVAGGSVTYTITASNAGPSDVSANVSDTFPASLTVSWTCVGAGGGTCTAGPVAGNISDNVNLPAGGSVTYTATANISPSATGSLANTATVSSVATDPNPGNNSATDTDTINSQADLAITKTDGVLVVIPGGSTTYTITASNAGPSSATGATVADTFPASITSASWTCVGSNGGTCTAGPVAGNISDTVNLPAGGSVTYTVNATISGAASGTISNTATVTAPGGVTDPVPGNNSATDNDTVVPPVNVTINQKTSAPAQADPTNSSTINFTAVFASAVTDFDDASDVTLSGTAGATTVVITGGPSTYNVAVSGMTGDGTVIVDIPAGVATGGSGQPNAASTSTDKTVTYDGTAPDTTIDSVAPVANPTNNNAGATFEFSSPDSGATFECQLDGGGFSGCSSARNYSVTFADGSHTFEVRAIDEVGNVDPTPATYTWVVDTIAPNTVLDLPTPNDPSNLSTFTFAFHGTDGSGSGIGSVECKLDSGSFFACDDADSHQFAGLSDGSHTVQFRAIDNAGNIDPTPASFTWVVDTVAPDTTIQSNPSNPTTSTTAPFTFQGTDTGGTGVASFQCKLDAGAFTACATFTSQSYSGLSDGSHTFQVRAVDNAGNVDSSPASFTWVIDTTAPDTTITSTNGLGALTNSTTATFDFTGNDGSGVGGLTFQCKLDSGSFAACSSASQQSYSSLANGSHTFQVRAIDSLGNVDATPASFTWTVDDVKPSVVVSSVTTSPTNISPITITITFSEAVTGFTPSTALGDIVIGGVGGTDSNPSGSGTTYTFDLTPSGQGAVTVTVPANTAQDAAANFNTISNTFSITYDSVAPTVTINQASGQSDPTSLSPVNFTVVFNEPISVASFTGADVTLGGTAGATTAVVTQIAPMDGTTFNVAVSGMSASGTVIPSITAVKVKDLADNDNAASTSTDNSVTFDNTPLTVTINQAATQTDPDFASSASKKIHFTAVFSEPVTGFTAADISFAGTTLMGTLTASVTQIAPMDGTTYDVGVKGMIPKGTVFVSIPANKANSIARGVGNQASTSTDNNVIVDYVLVEFTSTDSKDGWVLESTETSGIGGSLDSTSTVSRVGDNASDQQYRSIVDFATGSLPDSAVLFSVNLRVIEHSITGTNPFTTHGALKLDVKSGFFGTAGALQNPDFESAPDKSACNFETVPEFLEAIGTAYRCIVFESAYPYINLTGTTQFKMRFATDDNDDMSADIFSFYSGDYGGITQRPRLFVKYYIPPAP